MFTKDNAANLFIDILFKGVYRIFYRDMETMLLPDGMPGRVDDPVFLEEWWNSLDEPHQSLLREVVKCTIEETIIRFLAILDNSSGWPIRGQMSEFAVYLQTYQNYEDLSKNLSKETVRLNDKFANGYDDDQLQVLFYNRLNNAEENHSS